MANCEACGGETADDAPRCPSCGLAFRPAAEGSFVPPPAPQHVSIYLGQAPTVGVAAAVREADPLVEMPVAPRRPADPRAVRRAWIVTACVAAAVVAAIVVVVHLYRPNDSWTRTELLYARYGRSER